MKSCIAVACAVLCLCCGASRSFAAGNEPGRSLKSLSPLISGAHANLARSLAANRNWLDRHARPAVRQAYDFLESSASLAEANSNARGLTPHATALLGPMAINRFDLMQGVVFNSLAKKNVLASVNEDMARTVFHPQPQQTSSRAQNPIDYFKPVSESQTALPSFSSPSATGLASAQWDAWLTPIAAFERYDAKNDATANASADTLGLSTGFVRHFADYHIGFAGFYMRSAPTGGGWLADLTSYGLMAGLEAPHLRLGGISPWLRVGMGYTYSKVEQGRDDILGFSNKSSPGQHGIRLSANVGQNIPLSSWLHLNPSIGVDYTYVRQDGYTESGSGLRLAVQGASMHSVRPYLGGEISIRPLEDLTVSTHAHLRHEIADRSLKLSSHIVGTPLSFTSRGYQYSRSSGSGGVCFSWNASDDVSITARYDFLMGDRYPGHYAHAPAPTSFTGDTYDGSSGNGGIALTWKIANSVSLNTSYDAVFDGDAPCSLMNAVITWEF